MDLMGYFEQICAKLVQLSPITMIAGTYDVITIYLMDVNGIYKAVNITGGPQVVIQGALGVISVKTSKGTLIRGMPGLLMVFMFFFLWGLLDMLALVFTKGLWVLQHGTALQRDRYLQLGCPVRFKRC